MQLSIHLVTWNGERYIPHLFNSLQQQTISDWELCVLDNGSRDQTVNLLKRELKMLSVQHSLILRDTNLGFAGGHNALFQKTRGSYCFLINQDMALEPHCVERLMAYAHAHPDIAVIAPRIMQWNVQQHHRTDNIDAIGLRVFRSRRVLEQYAGQSWSAIRPRIHSPSDDLDIFGATGAAVLLRRDAAIDTSLPGQQIFDESYGSYKEDVDLAYRFCAAGYMAKAVLSAVVYHDRSSGTLTSLSDSAAAAHKQRQSRHVRDLSYINHLQTIIKNEYWQNTLLDFPWIAWYELKKLVWLLLHDREALSGLRQLWGGRKEIHVKRAHILARRRLAWRVMRQFWHPPL